MRVFSRFSDLRFRLKRILSNFPVTYKGLKYLTEREIPRGVKDDSFLSLEGYPRSGNSYAVNLIRGLLIEHYPTFFANHAERLLSHHTHRIAPLREAVSKGIPVFVLVRQPSEAISSQVLKQVSDPIDIPERVVRHSLIEYIDYYQFVSTQTDIRIVPFRTVIDTPAKFLQSICSVLGLEYPEVVDINRIDEFAKNCIRRWEEQKSNTDPCKTNLPDETKEGRKDVVKEQLRDGYPEGLAEAQVVFDELMNNRGEY